MTTILLADNNGRFRSKWENLLANEGYIVISASSPQEARKHLNDRPIDLALLDQRLIDDDDPKDISGWEIARDFTFRQIPKIILTGYPLDPGGISQLLDTDDEELRSMVDVLEKSDDVDNILSKIGEGLDKWQRRQISTAKVSDQIKKDYEEAQIQAKSYFRAAIVASILGFILIFIGIILVWFDLTTIGFVGSASGIMSEIMSYLFYKRSDISNRRMDYYHDELMQIYRLEIILTDSEKLHRAKREELVEKAILAAIDSWIRNHGGFPRHESPQEKNNDKE